MRVAGPPAAYLRPGHINPPRRPLSRDWASSSEGEGGVSSLLNPGRLIDYLEGLPVTQGRRAGEALSLLNWQRRFIRGVFRSGVETAAISIGRGNGKTTLLAAVAEATLDGPLVVPRSETVVVASSFEQARLLFDHCLAFAAEKLENRRRWRVWDSAQLAQIQCRETGARVRCLASDPRRAHGLAPSLILADEPAQWPPATSEKMLSALRTAAGKMPFTRFVALGTRPSDSEHWFAKLLSGAADYSQVHAARAGDPPFQRRTWVRANPSLDHMPDLERAIRKDAEAARLDPAELASFEAYRLNLGTADTLQQLLLSADAWVGIEGDATAEGRPVWGVDLGTSAAQSAVAAFWPRSGRLDAVSAFPTVPTLEERGLRDGVGRLYVDCARRGELITTGGAAVDVPELIAEALRRFGPPTAVSADRWREAELRDALQAAGVPVAALELRGQGFKDGGEDVRLFRRACLEGKVRPVRSLLLSAAMREARTVSDPAGNAKLAKKTEGGRRSNARDDAAAASILAVSAGLRRPKRRAGRYLGVA